jgi:hypothetical protein
MLQNVFKMDSSLNIKTYTPGMIFFFFLAQNDESSCVLAIQHVFFFLFH